MEFANLIANACLFGESSFGVRQHVAALESGDSSPHSKKQCFQGQASAPEAGRGEGPRCLAFSLRLWAPPTLRLCANALAISRLRTG